MEMKAEPLAALWLLSAQCTNTQPAQGRANDWKPGASAGLARQTAGVCRHLPGPRLHGGPSRYGGGGMFFALCFETDGRATLWWEMKGGNKYGGEANRDVWGSRRIGNRMEGRKL